MREGRREIGVKNKQDDGKPINAYLVISGHNHVPLLQFVQSFVQLAFLLLRLSSFLYNGVSDALERTYTVKVYTTTVDYSLVIHPARILAKAFRRCHIAMDGLTNDISIFAIIFFKRSCQSIIQKSNLVEMKKREN